MLCRENTLTPVVCCVEKKPRVRTIPRDDNLEKKYCCPELDCDYRTKYSWQVKNHMRQHTGEKPFFCTRCNFRTADSSRLLKHNRAHDLVTSQRCKICDLGFHNARGLVCHMRLSHGVREYEVQGADGEHQYPKVSLKSSKLGPNIWKCETCGLESPSRISHVTHCRIHTGERPFPCDKCAYRARQKESLKFHMKSHDDMESKAMGCEKCSFRTDHYATLSRHCKLFHKSPDENHPFSSEGKLASRKINKVGPWRCAKCNFETTTRIKLEQHRKDEHPKHRSENFMATVEEDGVLVYRCKSCDHACTVRSEMVSHLTTHALVRKHSCHLCTFKAVSRTGLSRHLVAIHDISHPNKCSVCDFSAVTFKELVAHKKSVHVRTQSTFKCQHCLFTSKDEAAMSAHQTWHKDSSVAFTCLQCGFTCYDRFQSKIHQSSHMKKGGGKVAGGFCGSQWYV